MSGEDDSGSFARLVGKVRRLRHDAVVLERPRPAPVPRRAQADAADAPEPFVAEEHGDATPANSYQRGGVQRSVLRKLQRGQYPLEDELDLHGLNLRDAGTRLAAFLERARGRRLRCVRIIHGKGLSSPGLRPVLKPQVLGWLRQHEAVLAYTAARAQDGGTGALYVLLRSRAA